MNTTAIPGLWKALFFCLFAGYGIFYAPYGVNETDGGFLTGLAWQVLNGKSLYVDIVYVRPPLPVWLRALELQVLPATWAILGERWMFYLKLALYSWLAATLLSSGSRRWQLATIGFIASAHCYPAAAWHTVDGILFGVLSIGCWISWTSRWGAALSGVFMAACLLCKQSFYPMAAVWLVLVVYSSRSKLLPAPGSRNPWLAAGAFFITILLFFIFLYSEGSLNHFLSLTNGATSGGQAFQHGVLDYFRIQPVVAGLSALLLAPVGWWCWKGQGVTLARITWSLWLIVLVASYVWAVGNRLEFTAPFAQTRLLFGVAAAWSVYRVIRKDWPREQAAVFFSLLALSWSAAMSWGYNLPVLFGTPWVFTAADISYQLFGKPVSGRIRTALAVGLLFLLTLSFRYGYEFVYRDGRRSAMSEHLGDIFPALGGIYSTPETAALYRDLKNLSARYGPEFKTLPAFPQANFLTDTYPPLPLDWVVEREMQAGREQVRQSLETKRPVLFIEKKYRDQLLTDPELALVSNCLRAGNVVEETPYFWVVK